MTHKTRLFRALDDRFYSETKFIRANEEAGEEGPRVAIYIDIKEDVMHGITYYSLITHPTTLKRMWVYSGMTRVM